MLSDPAQLRKAHGIELPSADVLVSELESLGCALQVASAQLLYHDRWSAASSSTVLMRDVFSQPKFYEYCSGYVCLLQDCALKGVSEAIAEGMGGCMGSLHGAGTPCLLRGWRQRGGGLLDCASALR